MLQGPVIVTGRLEPDPRGQVVVSEGHGQALEVLQRVHHRQTSAALLSVNADQHLMAVRSNVDGGQLGWRDRMDGGHSRYPQRRGLRKTTFET